VKFFSLLLTFNVFLWFVAMGALWQDTAGRLSNAAIVVGVFVSALLQHLYYRRVR